MKHDDVRKIGNLIKAIDDISANKLSRAALAFAELETKLEEMLPPSDIGMIEISRMLESASRLFGSRIALGIGRELDKAVSHD